MKFLAIPLRALVEILESIIQIISIVHKYKKENGKQDTERVGTE